MVSPMMSKEAVRYITQNITPDEVEYVTTINDIVNDCEENEYTPSQTEDVIYITKLMGFSDKFQNLHWSAINVSYHKAIDELRDALEDYKDAVAENIQSIVGQFDANIITKIDLPIGDNPLDIINQLKICVNNWFNLHSDDIEYEGCRNATSGFIETIHKYIYIFRLCKD